MPELKISSSPGISFRLTHSTRPDGGHELHISLEATPLQEPCAEDFQADIRRDLVADLGKPGIVATVLKEVYGTEASMRSISARSNDETSGREASSSRVCLRRVVSMLPSWCIAVTTAPSRSATVRRASAIAVRSSKAVASSIIKLLLPRTSPEAITPPADSTTRPGGPGHA